MIGQWIFLQTGLEGDVHLNTYIISVLGITVGVISYFFKDKQRAYERRLRIMDEDMAKMRKEHDDEIAKIMEKYDKMNEKLHEVNIEVLKQVNAISREISEFKRSI